MLLECKQGKISFIPIIFIIASGFPLLDILLSGGFIYFTCMWDINKEHPVLFTPFFKGELNFFMELRQLLSFQTLPDEVQEKSETIPLKPALKQDNNKQMFLD